MATLTKPQSNVILFPTNSSITVAEAVAKFEEEYFTKRARTHQTECTWRYDYLYVFRRLPQDEILTSHLLLDAVKSTQPDTKNRKRFCMVLRLLAQANGIHVDFSSYKGKYSDGKVSPRTLPTDEEIEQCFNQMTNPQWRWAFGMLAAYGLRPHELFYLDLEKLSSGDVGLSVLEGRKTGERLIFPFRPEWFEQFGLMDVRSPNCTANTNADYGQRVHKAFNRQRIPFPPYHLRHAWAVRSMVFGLDLSLAAQQMGHSMTLHSKTYHRWISDRVHRRAYETICER